MAPGGWAWKSSGILLLMHPKGQAQAEEPQEPPLPTLCSSSTVCSLPRDHHRPEKSLLLTHYTDAQTEDQGGEALAQPRSPSAVERRFEPRLAVDSKPLVLSHLTTCLHRNPTTPPPRARQGQTHFSAVSPPTAPVPAQPQPTPFLNNTSAHQVKCWPPCPSSCSSS